MKIISLKAQNFKRLEAVEIIPNENGITLITGNNDQGKTSVIDSIIATLKLTELNLKRPIKDGAERTDVEVVLDDFIVERCWTANDKSYLKVKTLDGAVYPSPQAMLDKLIGSLTLDPLEFMQLKPQDQINTLLKIVKFEKSPTTFDNLINMDYNARKEVNRDLDRLKKILNELPEPEYNLPNEEIDILELSHKKNVVLSESREHQKLVSYANSLDRQFNLSLKEVSAIESKIKALLDELETLKTDREKAIEVSNKLSNDMQRANDVVNDLPTENDIAEKLNAIDQEIAEAQRTNAKIKNVQKRQEIEIERDECFAKSEELTANIEMYKKEKADILAKAEFPIEGLGFDEAGVTYQGLPFAQASGSDQLKISLAIAMAMNPELRVIFSKHGDVFDDQKLLVMQELVKDKDYQFWLERIHPAEMPYILIEDGKVKEQNKELPINPLIGMEDVS